MIGPFRGEYRWLSNFWELTNPVVLDGEQYHTVEHAYQAAKYPEGSQARKRIQAVALAAHAKGFAKVLRPHRTDVVWDEVKLDIMYGLVRQKFANDPVLAKLLLDTGQQVLVEVNTWHDTFWGVCNGVGDNHLGKIIMRVREEQPWAL
ncbi:MAG: NADAR family protein [Gaiellales bacterium]|nr:MAG: NADAR family protein [Gaiellales bacterium]